jgi:HAMP domain-containing protein
LRKVREELDHLAAQEARQRKLIRTLVIVAVAVFLVLLFVVWRNVSSRADKRETAPVQIPSKVDMSKKPAPTPAEPGK